MGIYFNPNNGSFRKDKNSKIYVDKTGLLEYLNEVINTADNCIAVSHARRFGKSHAAGMIDAYYSLGSDSRELFNDTEIAKASDYEDHLNKYNVIHLDISSIFDTHKDDLMKEIQKRICQDWEKVYGQSMDYTKDLYSLIAEIYALTGIPFVIIIDEWDCVIRNSSDRELVHAYLQFLHSLFKSEESKSFLALAYITGILPIKKIEDESALNNFEEFTMVRSLNLTKFYGFTEEEVKDLCDRYGLDFETMKAWYNGYVISGYAMYNPNSVCSAIRNKSCDSYWRNTSSFESINNFIKLNYEGLKDDILTMLTGQKVSVKVDNFKNDLTTVASKDDALTALIHLGYLAYDEERRSAYVPNDESGVELRKLMKIPPVCY